MTVEPCRSGLLAAGVRAWRAGRCAPDDVLHLVTGHDEPHRVHGLPVRQSISLGEAVDGEDGEPLVAALLALRDQRPTAALVVPGDPRGLPGPGPLTDAALLAGEAVVGDTLGLVPVVSRHGSAVGSQAVVVRWQAHPVEQRRDEPLDVATAEHELTDALREAASLLSGLDVASWRPELAEAVAMLRRPTRAPTLPAGFEPRSLRVLSQADRLDRVLQLAAMDAPGGAVNAHEARSRQEALAGLATAVRRARAAAYNAPVPAVDSTGRR